MSADSNQIALVSKPLGLDSAIIIGALAAFTGTLFVFSHIFIGIVAGLLVLALSAFEVEAFLLLVIFLVPVGWFARLGLGDNTFARVDVATFVRLLAVVGFFIGRLLRSYHVFSQVFRHPVSKASVVFGAVTVVSLGLGSAGLTRDSIRSVVFIASYLGFFFMIAAWVDSRRRLRKVLLTLLCSIVVAAVFAFVQKALGGYTSLWLFFNPPAGELFPWNGRVTSFLNYSNSFAGYLNLVLPFALACCVLPLSSGWRWLGLWALVLGALALSLTQSIGGIIAFVCITFLSIFAFVRGWRKRLGLSCLLLAATIALYALGRALNPSHSAMAMAYDVAGRFTLWATAWHMFLQSPLLGVGYGNFIGLYGHFINLPWIPPGTYDVHNIYLQFLAETGLVGFLSFFYLIYLAFRAALVEFRTSNAILERAVAFGVLGATVSVLVHGFVDFLFEVSPPFGTSFWMLLALLVVCSRLSARRKKTCAGAGESVRHDGGLTECA